MSTQGSIYTYAGSDEGIRRIEEDSALMCDMAEAFHSSILLGDYRSAVQWVHGWIQVWFRPLRGSR
jgi:hypothetical protein